MNDIAQFDDRHPSLLVMCLSASHVHIKVAEPSARPGFLHLVGRKESLT